MTAGAVATDRWELMRALGAIADDPAASRTVGPALGLEPVTDAEHTGVFVLNLPPYASVYLGPDGCLGGEATDRVAGFWRAIGITPPPEPDHLSALLGLYASLGEAMADARHPASVAAMAHWQASLFWEHLWPWLPAYLDAVTDLKTPALARWADLMRHVIAAEFTAQPVGPQLPLALRQAPGLSQPGLGLDELVAVLTTPVRSGMILTRHGLARGAGQAGVGHRIGERRFTLRCMLGQDPGATLSWAASQALRWRQRHSGRIPDDAVTGWWAARAGRTAQLLQNCAAAVAAVAAAAMP